MNGYVFAAMTFFGVMLIAAAGFLWDLHRHCFDQSSPYRSQSLAWAERHKIMPASLKKIGNTAMILGFLVSGLTFVLLYFAKPAG